MMRSRRKHHKIIVASECARPTSEGPARDAWVNRSSHSSGKETAVKDAGNQRRRKLRRPFWKPSAASHNHVQKTCDDVVLEGKGLQTTPEWPIEAASANISARCPEKKTAVVDNDTHRGSEPSPTFQIPYPCKGQPSPITYVLQGFTECPFLDMRRTSFLEPLPASCFCAICGALPPRTRQLPCGHGVCLVCWYTAYDRAGRPHQANGELIMFLYGLCPKDGVRFSDPALCEATCSPSISTKLVYCVNGVLGCRFKVELRDLEAHCLYECRFKPTRCTLCGRDDIAVSKAVQHFVLCAGLTAG